MCSAQSEHLFSCFPSDKVKNLGVPIYKEKLNRQNGVPYKLAIGKMMNGLNKSFSTMVLPLGQKMGLGAIAPIYIYIYIYIHTYIYAQPYHKTAGHC
jgi:hypothetical protein